MLKKRAETYYSEGPAYKECEFDVEAGGASVEVAIESERTHYLLVVCARC